MSDVDWMRRALELAQRAEAAGEVPVGALVVRDEKVLGEGWNHPIAAHDPTAHAEILALRAAAAAVPDYRLGGATLYVTLEPCSHQGKTPPCAEAIIRSGIARVVSAMDDPNPDVAGQGHAKLRERGIAVETGLFADEARRTHAGHIRRICAGRPQVLLKLAVSADGKAGLAGRKPVAITGEEARIRVHAMRAAADAILVGVGTVLADDPHLTCRLPGMMEQSPVRVVLDARLRVPLATSIVATAREVPTWVFAGADASAMAEDILRAKGVEVFRVEGKDGRLAVAQVVAALAERGITRLMVEGGPMVAASLVQAGLADEVALFRSEKAVGPDGVDALESMPLTALTDGMKFLAAETVGADRLELYERE